MENNKPLGKGLPKNEDIYIKLHQHGGIATVAAAMVAAVLIVLCVMSIFLTKPTYSEIEKRDLAPKPSFTPSAYVSGDYMAEADSYYNDTFPLRNYFVALHSTLEEFKGIRMDDIKIIEAVPSTPNVGGEEDEDIGKQLKEEDKKPPEVPDNGETGEQNGALFIYGGKALSMFGGSPGIAKQYAAVVNAYADALEGVQVYDLIVPTHIEFALPPRYSDISGSQRDNIDIIYGALQSGVKSVDAYSHIEMHNDEYLYFATDHHWTARGAYYAYEAFCEEAGLQAVPLSSIEFKQLDSFLGTLYNQTQDRKLRENPDYVEYPSFKVPHTVYRYQKNQPYTPYASTLMAEYATGTNSYSVFLHGDHPLTEIQTEVKNGRKIVVVKESFGNAFAPYLINNFETVYVVDQRYFQISLVNFIKEKGVTDLLFINNIFAANTPYHIQCIQNLMYQQFVLYTPPPVVPEEPPVDDPLPEQPVVDGGEPALEQPATEPPPPESSADPVPEEPPAQEVMAEQSEEIHYAEE